MTESNLSRASWSVGSGKNDFIRLPIRSNKVRLIPSPVCSMNFLHPDDPPDRGPETKNEWGVLLIIAFFFFFLIVLELARDFTPAKWSVPFFLISWVGLLVLHEFGHAAAAWAVGWRVRLISIGTGKIRAVVTVQEVPVEWRTVPLSGFVIPQPTDLVLPRLKQFVIYAAGPGIELITVALIAAIFGTDSLLRKTDDVGVIALQSYCVAAIFGAGLNLIPFSHQTKEGSGWSDGLGMLLCWRIPDEIFARRIEEE